MEIQQIRDRQDQFGEVSINGSIYHKRVHAFIREITGDKVRIERLEGSDLIVKCEDVVSMKVKKAPELIE